jgi:thymidylate synthase (FAD)
MKAEYIDHMGNDDAVADAARVSFDKLASMFTPEQNANLIRFLARGCTTKHWNHLVECLVEPCSREFVEEVLNEVKNMPVHWTPFGHCQIKLRMSAPVPIRTQCFKHKQGFTENEESRRYIKSTPELYVPDAIRAAPEGSVKQGSGGVHPDSDQLVKDYQFFCGVSIRAYEEWIERGVCPEQARFLLPQGVKVNWVWTGSLYAYANFYNKRSDSHAQKEIQELAEQVNQIVAPLFPVSWSALTGQEVSTNG